MYFCTFVSNDPQPSKTKLNIHERKRPTSVLGAEGLPVWVQVEQQDEVKSPWITEQVDNERPWWGRTRGRRERAD